MFVYILFSASLDRFYVGSTEAIEERLKKHNSGYYPNSFTSKAHDWSIYWSAQCADSKQARAIEGHIKKMKSRNYYLNLVKHPEIFQRLQEKYFP